MNSTDYIINSSELNQLLNERPKSIVLLDVREDEEVIEDKIPGSLHISLGELMSRANTELNPDSDIVIYCAHGVRSMHALMGLRSLGFEKLRSLEGGLCAYRESY